MLVNNPLKILHNCRSCIQEKEINEGAKVIGCRLGKALARPGSAHRSLVLSLGDRKSTRLNSSHAQ